MNYKKAALLELLIDFPDGFQCEAGSLSNTGSSERVEFVIGRI